MSLEASGVWVENRAILPVLKAQPKVNANRKDLIVPMLGCNKEYRECMASGYGSSRVGERGPSMSWSSM